MFLVLFGAKNDIIFTSVIVSLSFSFVFFIFLKIELADRMKFILDKMKNFAEEKSDAAGNSYEEKINGLNDIMNELDNSEKFFKSSKEISELFAGLKSITARINNELTTARFYKVNRNEFLGNVSHELRTPIFAIQLSLETLIDGAVKDDNVNMDFLGRALKQTNRLKELLDDLINISQLETGMKISKRYFEINRFINGIAGELKGLSEKRNVEITLESSVSDKTRAFGDEERIKQVIVNLIDNAIKYASEKGEIKIKISKTEKDVIISISDNGIGIPKDDLPRIFERFYRVDKTRSRDMGGSGLGLSIVKHILELHSSTITVESEEGKGTKFEFNLPS